MIPAWWYREVVNACVKSQALDELVMQALLTGIPASIQADLPIHTNLRVQALIWLQHLASLDTTAICGNDLYLSVFLQNAILIAPEGQARARLESCWQFYQSYVERARS